MGKNNGDRRGRPIVQSSKIRYDRVKKFMNREGLDHDSHLADKINVPQQSLSRVLGSMKISDYYIDQIIKYFPNYRKQWFLGYDEYPTWDEYEAAKQQETRQRVESILGTNESVSMFMSAILLERGYILRKIPNSIGADIDCRMYELIDPDENVICYRDDKIADRILRHAELELTQFLSDAILEAEKQKESPSP